jgi:hypothetical protein
LKATHTGSFATAESSFNNLFFDNLFSTIFFSTIFVQQSLVFAFSAPHRSENAAFENEIVGTFCSEAAARIPISASGSYKEVQDKVSTFKTISAEGYFHY